MNNKQYCEYTKELEYNNQTNKVWYNHYRGYIVKSYIDSKTNMIIQEKIPYNQPNNFLYFLDNYFENKLK
jgi:hypothetical protein